MSLQYVKALFDFVTSEPGEICLKTGDVVLILYQVDDNWICGKLFGQVGNFPTPFVAPVDVPEIQPGQKLFVGVKDFITNMSGDLSFYKGDVILGLKPIDKSWWHGQNGDKFGMFPITHVRQLDTAPPGELDTIQSQVAVLHKRPEEDVSSKSNSSNILRQKNTTAYIAKSVANMDLTAQLDDELGFAKGDIINIIQLSEDDFAIGECNGKIGSLCLAFVDVIEGNLKNDKHKDSDIQVKRRSKFRWWEEESSNDSIGCDDNFQPNSLKTHQTLSQESSNTPLYTSQPQNEESNANNIAQEQRVVPDTNDFAAQPSHLVMDESVQTSQTYNYNAQYLKTNFLESTGNIPAKTHRRVGSYTQENTRTYDTSITPYGKTVFPFVAENSNELTFFDNEIVTLIQHVDDQWIEGEIDGKQGIFPTSYVDIIVDCPWCEYDDSLTDHQSAEEFNLQKMLNESTEEETNDISQESQTSVVEPGIIMVTDEQELHDEHSKLANDIKDTKYPDITSANREEKMSPVNNASKVTVHLNQSQIPECYGRLMYDFKPESDNPEDLSVLEGDTVTIIKKADEYWFEIVHDDGRHGFCPINYVEVIHSKPLSDIVQEVISLPQEEQIESEKTLPLNNTKQVNDVEMFESQTAKPKPLVKPKPVLKPKPADSKKFSSVPRAESTIKHETNLKGTETSDTMNNNKKVNNPQPKRPPIPPTQRIQQNITNVNSKMTCTNAVFVRTESFTMDSSLDNIIKDQMKIATAEAKESRSRSASVRSDSSLNSSISSPAIPPRYNVPARNYSPLKSVENTLKNDISQESLDNIEKKVAFSTFYDISSDSAAKIVPSRPAPIRPPEIVLQTSTEQGKSPSQRPPLPKTSSVRSSASSTAGNSKLSNNTRDSHIIPRRKAPPRPKHMAARAVNNDLMLFSPDGERSILGDSESEVNPENAQAVADLHRRIQDIEDDIQAYTKNQQELERFLKKDGTSKEEAEKVKENLDFTVANITGLSSELNQLRENLYVYCPERRELDQDAQKQAQQQRLLVEEKRKKEEQEKKHKEEMVKKRIDTRQNVIEELVQTEKDYLRSISICYDIFFSENVTRHPQVDHEALFGNIEEVIKLSQRLLSSLEEATQGKEFEQQKIGECFVHLKKDMIKVLAPYCTNHEDVITMLENYEKKPDIEEYFIQKVEEMKNQMTVFDLGSILIKPVQRVLKYPLLLDNLLKNTEEDHHDKFHLLVAITNMTQVAATINEHKRRKDLVKKYKAEKKEDLGDKLSRLNVHSTKKKLSRLSTHLVGVQTTDENFNREERKFKNLEAAVRTLVRNMTQYIEQVQLSIFNIETLANDLSDYYNEKSGQQEIQQYCQVANQMAMKHFNQFKKSVEMPVILPLNRLLVLYQAPDQVIKKRYDKLLDYDKLANKGQGDSTTQKHVEMIKNNYEALNAQLLDELPQLFQLSMEIITDCLTRFIETQKLFYDNCLNEMYTLLGLQLVLSTTEQDLLENFNVTHQQIVEKLSDLSFMTKTFNSRLEERKGSVRGRRSSENKAPVMDSINQSQSQRQQLQQQYSKDKLFTTISGVSAAQQMDLPLSVGCLVVVMKEGDPMGNKDRWFVYDGNSKGFVLKKYLVPYSPSKSRKESIAHDETGQTDLLCIDDKKHQPVSPMVSWNQSTEDFDPFSGLDQSFQSDKPAYNQLDVVSIAQPNAAFLHQSISLLQPEPVNNISQMQSSKSRNKSDSSAMEYSNRPLTVSQPDSIMLSKKPMLSRSDTVDELEEVEETQYYQAIYTFQARTELEVNLVEGQYVKVIEKHDLEGNPEWWLLESQGQKGYAPANYIYEVQ